MTDRHDPFHRYRPNAAKFIPTQPPADSFHSYRSREFAHLSHIDALAVWNAALRLAVRKLGAEPHLTRDVAVRMLQELYGDAF